MAKRPAPAPPAPPASWSPIATAPTDGQDVLILVGGTRQLIAHWNGTAWVADAPPVLHPTQWHPLIEGPKE
jgi:hypothetical protein